MKKMINPEVTDLLKKIGLNQYESNAYSILLKNSTLTASNVADRADIPRSRAYDVLENLVKMGLVTTTVGRPTKFAALGVEDAFEILKTKKLEDHKTEIEKIESIKNHLKKKLKESKQPLSSEEFVWILKERANIHSKLSSLLKDANKNVLIISTEKGLDRKVRTYEGALRAAKRKGANVKIVGPASQEILKNSDFAEVVKRDNIHRAVVVDDHSLLFVTPEDSEKEIGVLIKSPFFAESIRRLF